MNPFDPVLSRPQSIDGEYLDAGTTYPLANQDISFCADAYSDLHDLVWPWVGEQYAAKVQLHISNPHDDAFMPMVTQFYPGYQETIYGAEGMIVTKRIAAPFQTSYDRSVLWILECQAEGDRLLRIEVDIDWGEPLSQRIVDGLLVAQGNPGSAQGIYRQHNADSTRVFGNPQGRASSVEIDNDRHAKLVYYVLVNGIVEVPLILTVSDVGEQMAWNGFLSLRDSERAFERSDRAWEDELSKGSLWTPDPRFNRALKAGRTATIAQTQRLRTGLAPSDRDTRKIPLLVDSFDSFDVVQSNNLLAHLRRVAERTDGELPLALPIHPKAKPEPPGVGVVDSIYAYVHALNNHLNHGRRKEDLLDRHYRAVQSCAETLVRGRREMVSATERIAQALHLAAHLAMRHGSDADEARWRSEARDAMPDAIETLASEQRFGLWDLPSTWHLRDNGVWTYSDPWHGIELAGRAIWNGCGLFYREGRLAVEPTWPSSWSWWALIDFPWGERAISLVWDGTNLHSTIPIVTRLPVVQHDRIRTMHAGEYDFDLQFEFASDDDGSSAIERFHPTFLGAAE